MTPPGIDPETDRLVSQCLNHYATPGPPRVGRWRKTSSPLGSHPRTFQPVVSRYTDWAIPAHSVIHVKILNVFRQPRFPISCAPPVHDSSDRHSLHYYKPIPQLQRNSSGLLQGNFRLDFMRGDGRSSIGTDISSRNSVLLLSITSSFPKLYSIHPSLTLDVLTKMARYACGNSRVTSDFPLSITIF